MGWQDRDYASRTPEHGPVYRTVGPGSFGQGSFGGRSIVTTLIIINVVIYVLGALSPQAGALVFGYGALQGQAVLHGQIWRLLTAQYLHAGTGHLLINMLVLHFLGRSLERMWSPRKFFTLYTLCGLAGNVFYTLLAVAGWIPISLPAVGASGCIYGLLGIVAVMFPQATVYVYFLFPIKIRTAAFIFGGIAVLMIIQRGSNFGGEACHLAGLAFGVWWAWRGERWWSYRGRAAMDGVASSFRGAGSRPARQKPKGFTAKVAERRKDQATVDQILKKVYEGGIHSLSEREKRALQEATERQRQRDKEAGRIDRL